MTAHVVTVVRPDCCHVCSHYGHALCHEDSVCLKTRKQIILGDTCPPSWCPLPGLENNETPLSDEFCKLENWVQKDRAAYWKFCRTLERELTGERRRLDWLQEIVLGSEFAFIREEEW
jgi:hypothetical protein